MYLAHFNLREPPFSIAPDPAFLYLSARHQEALGHLLYGTGQYGGFVQLTGEVGTGKTTIVRTLLAQKLDQVDVATIHNPRQNELEFVQSICDELGVAYDQPATSIKALVDALNAHLLATHAAGRRTVLIIDEAQNLDPAVLEQVRLLTNLETDKEKLLRIMLIGQPELIELLARPELRQLASRITARYHLTPLTAQETSQYIVHRLRVAGGAADLFTAAAMRRVHRHARGVPRQINILCDRALLGAYARGLRTVGAEIVERAAAEALGVQRPASRWRGRFARLRRPGVRWIEGTLALAALIVAAVLLRQMLDGQPHPPAVTGATAAAAQPAPATDAKTPADGAAKAAAAPAADAAQPADGAALDADLGALRASAEPLPQLMERLIGLWDPGLTIPSGENVCAALAQRHLECYKGSGDWNELSALNRPAILTLNPTPAQVQYVLLRGLDGAHAVLDTPRGPLRYGLDQLDALWNGEFLLLWRKPIAAARIGPGSRGADVLWLRKTLAQIAGDAPDPSPSPVYDSALRAALLQFQSAHGLAADGIAGKQTLLVLSNLRSDPGTPNLSLATK
ncbi:MAG: AAA family ATPase [Nevskia sp.]|nr:AAA family ATPase [Nevskia sp.]